MKWSIFDDVAMAHVMYILSSDSLIIFILNMYLI